MNEIENKVLGKIKEQDKEENKKPAFFGKDNVWEVFKEGCGKSYLSGIMVYEMMNYEAKKEVGNGKKEINCNGFSFKFKK